MEDIIGILWARIIKRKFFHSLFKIAAFVPSLDKTIESRASLEKPSIS